MCTHMHILGATCVVGLERREGPSSPRGCSLASRHWSRTQAEQRAAVFCASVKEVVFTVNQVGGTWGGKPQKAGSHREEAPKSACEPPELPSHTQGSMPESQLSSPVLRELALRPSWGLEPSSRPRETPGLLAETLPGPHLNVRVPPWVEVTLLNLST